MIPLRCVFDGELWVGACGTDLPAAEAFRGVLRGFGANDDPFEVLRRIVQPGLNVRDQLSC